MKKKLLFTICCIALLALQTKAQSLFLGSSLSNNGAYGAVFNFYTGSNSFNTVFNNSLFNGWFNSGIIKSPDGRFFATGYDGGSSQTGAVLQINPYNNSIATTAEFSGGIDGAYPQGPMVGAADGYLYGLCKQGGSNGSGCIYRYDPNTGIITGIQGFGVTEGHTPMGGLLEVGGLFYGLTSAGGANNEGTIFSYNYSNGTYTVLYDFAFATGSGPRGSFILASDGDLYATVHDGAGTNRGGIVKLDLPSNTVTITPFAFGSQPQDPDGDLLQYGGSLLYGTTTIGGAYNYGTLYTYDITNNVVNVLRSFDNTAVMGGFPKGTPVLAVYDGKMYGVANGGGSFGNGVVYQYDPVFDNYVKKIDVNDILSTDFGSQKLIEYHPLAFNTLNVIQNDPCNDGNCEGKAVISVSGGTGAYSYTWLPSGENNDTALVLCAGTHTVQVTEPGGGIITQTVNITQPSATLDISALQINPGCAGTSTSEAVATASGGTLPYSYSWSNSVNNDTTTGLSAAQYTAYVMDANGCGANIPINISEQTTYVVGHVSTLTDNPVQFSANSAAYAFKYQPGGAGFDTMDITGITPSGEFDFFFLDSGQYLVKVILDTAVYPLSIPTYNGNTFQWDSSLVVNHGCIVNDTINIQVMELDTSNTGPGIISGYIIEQAGYGTGRYSFDGHQPNLPFTPGGPLKGIDVKLGKNPAGGIQARTTSDSTGFYVFENLPLEDFKIYVDIPNLPMDSTRLVSLNAGNTLSEQNNYFADSASVYIVDTLIVGIYASEKTYDNQFSIFPNPASNLLHLRFETKQENSWASFEICDARGLRVYEVKKQAFSKGENILSLHTASLGLKAGVYFVSILSENTRHTQRIVVIE